MKKNDPMNQVEETVEGIVVDICSRSFLLVSDQGSQRKIDCDNQEEFLSILRVCDASLNPEQIVYAEIAITEPDGIF